jgi:glucosamine--fructose-6-phosphate aminotransferase (isomerizing)
MTDSLMLREAEEAPEAAARTLATNARAIAELARELRADRPRFVLTAARGSSAHAAAFGKYLIETRAGVVTAAAAPAVVTLYRARLDLEGALFLAISQSGRSPDLVAQAEAARAAGARTVALVNDPASPLAAACGRILPIGAGPEKSVAATKSFIASLAALLQLAAAWAEDAGLAAALERLPQSLTEAAALDWSPAIDALELEDDMLVVGRGLGLPVAAEAALKLKETCALHAESFSAAELMHGPVALVGAGYPVLVFAQEDETRPGVTALVSALRSKGARVLAAEPGPPQPGRLPVAAGLHPACDPVLLIQAFYAFAARLAVRRGLDPDRPRHLSKVTLTR